MHPMPILSLLSLPTASASLTIPPGAIELTASSKLDLHGTPLQVSVDVPWSPYDVDGRNYDWLGLAESADILFVMSYDMQSQVTIGS